MNDPVTSVVLPVHNGEPHIADAVCSILAQTFSDFELILCDDGSDDGTSAILSDFAKADARVRLFRRPAKSGVAAAANWAISEARASLVAIAHADDLSHPDRLARQVKLMLAEPECVLTGAPAAAIDWHGRPAHPANLWRLIHPSAFAPMAHSSAMFRRAAFYAAGGYRAESDYWEDLDIYWRLAQHGRIYVSVQPLTTYRYSKISIRERDSSVKVEKSLEAMYRSAEAIGSGRQPHHLPGDSSAERLHPRVFVARTWSRLWAGERACVMSQLLARGKLQLNRATLESLGFIWWATVAPKSLRRTLRFVTRWRNRLVERKLRDVHFVEWDPLRLRQSDLGR